MTDLVQAAHNQPGALPLTVLCRTVDLPRATFYRLSASPNAEVAEQIKLRKDLHRLATQWPTYGYRRLTQHLHREGYPINHKRVLRIMREEGLCCRPRRTFVVTTQSGHSFRIYTNLARDLKVTAPNQLWVADITYIHLPHDTVYLAVILDAFSRRAIGWQLSQHLDAPLTTSALQKALLLRGSQLKKRPGQLIHHSDQGIQYAATLYTSLLNKYRIRISMSRRGNPYDNALAERFMRTLKEEEVYLNDYETILEARRSIGKFIDSVYNHERIHSKLGYLTPVEFERSLTTKTMALKNVSF